MNYDKVEFWHNDHGMKKFSSCYFRYKNEETLKKQLKKFCKKHKVNIVNEKNPTNKKINF